MRKNAKLGLDFYEKEVRVGRLPEVNETLKLSNDLMLQRLELTKQKIKKPSLYREGP